MKIENIYDKHLQAIEEAEERVRVAKLDLQEAERELDETLSLVEAFLIGENGKIDNREPKEFENKKEAERFIKEKKLRSDYKDVRVVSAKDINR